MNCEDVTFSERGQTRGTVWFCLYEMSRNGQSTVTERASAVAGNCGRKMGSDQVSLWGDDLSWN